MRAVSHLVTPPAPHVHARDLGSVRLLLGSVRNSLGIWPDYAFDTNFTRNTLFGVETVLVNSPEGVRHVMAANASNYVRPAMMARIMRPLLGRGLFLAEGEEWRRQRRLLSPSFTPQNVNVLLPHLVAAAGDLVGELDGQSSADLSSAYEGAALNAALRALFSMPEKSERDRIGSLVCQFVTGPGRPQIFDGFAKSETSFAFALGRRRNFQKRWFKAVGELVAARQKAPHEASSRDLLDLLLAARDTESGEPLANDEVRDQCATMIFGGYETTARLLFWASYLLTLDGEEQERVRAEVAAFFPDQVTTLSDLENWPRLRRVVLEALRLYPSVPLLVREPLEDDVILGEPVRRGVQVYIAPWVLHRHRAHWENPTAFLPDRFEGQSSPWTSGGAYLPFGAGPRICIGAVFAMAEAQIMLASVLNRFTLTLDGDKPVMPVGRLTIQPSYSPMFKLERTV
ncbi:MAG: cytochrome P450 [Alphaproteobacteria bacterium]|nr:cytochrome P450 [Alphaproteobacteria bacterium]